MGSAKVRKRQRLLKRPPPKARASKSFPSSGSIGTKGTLRINPQPPIPPPGTNPLIKRANQRAHDDLVARAAAEARRRGYAFIKADLPGGVSPSPVNGHVPDVATQDVLIECETPDSIDHAHTKDEWTAFATSSRRFIVCVPKGFAWKAEKRADTLGLRDKVVEFWEL